MVRWSDLTPCMRYYYRRVEAGSLLSLLVAGIASRVDVNLAYVVAMVMPLAIAHDARLRARRNFDDDGEPLMLATTPTLSDRIITPTVLGKPGITFAMNDPASSQPSGPRMVITNANPPLERLKRWLVERKTKKPAQNQSVNQLLVPSVRLNPHGHPMHRDAIPGYDCPYTQAIINAPPAMKVNEQAVKQLLMDEPREVRVYRYWLFVFITVGALRGFQKRAWAVRPNVYILARCNGEVVGDACTPELWARLYADLKAQWTIDGMQPICHKNGNTIELAVSVAEALKPYGLAQSATGEFVYHPEWIERAAHQRVLVEKVR